MPMLSAFLLATTLAPAPVAEAPADLVGEWRYGAIRGTTYWDSSSGAYLGDGGGNSDTLIFAKDGSYREYVYIKSSPTAGWTTQIFTSTEGKWSVNGDKVVLKVTKGNYRVADNRVQKSNYTRPMTDEEVKKAAKSYRFSMVTEDGKPVFVLHLTDKETMKYQWVEKAKKD